MTIRTCRLMLLISLGLSLSTIVAWAGDQDREFHWSGKLAAEQLVQIKGVNGNIDAEGTSGDQVEVTAEKSGPNADQVKIEVVTSSDGVIVCAIYPHSWGAGPCTSSWHASHVNGHDAKVHFIIRMPKNLRFSGQNVNGDVNANGLGRAVRAESVNGSVRVSTTSWADAETVNGSIRASLGSSDWKGTLSFKSVNGSVVLSLPDDLSADVSFKSVNGNISSDFPITVSGNFIGHSAKGRIGNGGRELLIETVNGSVELKKSGGSV